MKHTLVVLLVLFGSMSLSAQSFADRAQQFQEETGAKVRLSASTQTPNFIRLPQNRALRFSGNLKERTDAFLSEHSNLFGIEDANEELHLKGIKEDKLGFQRYTLEQHYQGVPVFDGQLHFHFNPNQDISAVNGNFIPAIRLNARPTLSLTAAALLAVEEITQQQREGLNAPLFVNKNTLYIFNPGMAKGHVGRTSLVYEIEVRNDLDVREFIFIDAHDGSVVEQYTGIACALSRRLYETNTSNEIWAEGDAFPGTLNLDQRNEVETSGHTYHFFDHAFNYASYDGADAEEMQTINNNAILSCPNANWNGTTTNFCSSTAADDVIAHEWAHAYTEYTNGLIYSYQPGAINEALSDIWGETIDLLNNYEDAGEDNSVRSGTGCTESNRWKIGEDATAFSGGPVRDMWVPSCNGHPDKALDINYHCLTSDNGGVHINSGVPNHAYALLVDGGTFNGQTVAALGFEKAAHIFWRAQSVYLTRTSDFIVLADALEQACQDLLGVNLEGLSTTATAAGLSGQVITAADCITVTNAIDAVEMDANNPCGYTPLLGSAPTICSTGTPANIIFSEDWEAGIGSWTVAQNPTNPATWDARDWVLDSSLPRGRAGSAMYGETPDAGNCFTDLDNGIISLQSPVINISASATGPILMAFDHYVALEDFEDGGQVHYKLNSGAWTRLPGSSFTANGYNKNIVSNNNPYANQEAFVGADEGSLSGTWGQSQIDLSLIGVVPGDNLELRWDVATNGCKGWEGWYLDDIVIYSCTPIGTTNISFSTPSSVIGENQADIANGCLDYYETTIRVQIDADPSEPVDVTLSTSGTATMGTTDDYTFSPAMFTLDGATLMQDITVQIHNDALIEGNEDIIFSYTLNVNGGNGSAGMTNQTHTLTINEDDFLPTNTTSGTLFSENFDSGIGSWTITDGGNTTDTWSGVISHNGTNTLDGSAFLFVNSDPLGSGTVMYETAETPVINTAGVTNIVLDFEQFFRRYNPGYEEMATVDVFDGTTWQNILTQSASTTGGWSSPTLTSLPIPDAYANSNMKIRFIYDSEWDYWWAIDNVELTGDAVSTVQSPMNISAGDTQYLGPNAEIYFYDSVTGNIMARIKNLSAHDYGCTTVEVERAGTAASQAWAAGTSDYIADKTFQVTPEFNDPTGSYEISLYYTEAEIVGWETATGRPRADLAHIRTSNDLPTPTAADTRTYVAASLAAFGSDWIYTASYATGFSDFGIGPIEPSVSVAPKVFLQGPFSGAAMSDNLRTAGLLPTTEPYTALGYTHINGGGGESLATARLATTGTKAVVDWVIVELRDIAPPHAILATRAALLLADGAVVDTDGASAVRFSGMTAGNYHVAVRHRNHLGVMTATVVDLN